MSNLDELPILPNLDPEIGHVLRTFGNSIEEIGLREITEDRPLNEPEFRAAAFLAANVIAHVYGVEILGAARRAEALEKAAALVLRMEDEDRLHDESGTGALDRLRDILDPQPTADEILEYRLDAEDPENARLNWQEWRAHRATLTGEGAPR